MALSADFCVTRINDFVDGQMLKKIGNAIYWASLLVAIPTALFGFWATYREIALGKGGVVVAVALLIVPAVVIWMLGLALRYLFVGAKRTKE